MAKAQIGCCSLELHLPEVTSLKGKRGILKSLLTRVRNQFNVSAAEYGHQDLWQSSLIALVCVSNSQTHCHQMLQSVVRWIEDSYPEIQIVAEEMEML